MTNEPVHTASKGRMTPGMLLNYLKACPNYQLLPKAMLCFQLCLARYTVLQMKTIIRRTSAINPVTTENLLQTYGSQEGHK